MPNPLLNLRFLAQRARRNKTFLRIFLFILFVLCGVPLPAAESPFTFLEKAKTHYHNLVMQARPDNSNATVDSLLKINSTTKDFNSAFEISWKIGLYLLEHGKYASALSIYDEIRNQLEVKADKTLEDKKKLSSVLNVSGAIYEETGLWNEAMAMYMRSLQICEEIGYNKGKAKIFNNIGKLYYNRNDFRKAEELYNKAVAINMKLNIRPELFNNYNNLAGIYLTKGDPQRALNYMMTAMSFLDINSDYYDLSVLYANIGLLYEKLGNYPVSFSYFSQAAKIQEEKLFSLPLIHTYLSVASLDITIKNYDSATVYLSKSMKLADAINNPSEKLAVLKLSAKFYMQTGKSKESSDLYASYIRLNDSLENLNSIAKIEQIQAVYSLINKEKDNKILQQTINLQHLAIQRQRVVLVAATILLLSLGSFLLTFQRNRRRERTKNEFIARQTERLHQQEKEMMLGKEQNLEMELDYKKKELTLNVMSLMKVNEMLTEISEKIVDAAKSAQQQETKSVLKMIGKEVQKRTDIETMKEFSLRFKEVNKDFFEKLLSKYPDLSPSELKLCAFLKLNMSTKEISELTGQQQKALETARYRLRQKLGIANSDVKLVTFIAQI
jgi:tetratricopeptide (TPR) repeat protein